MKQPTLNTKKKRLPRIGRVTEVVLSIGCLFLFALSMSIITGLPIYFLRSWLPSLEQHEYVLFFSAYLLLLPLGFLGARHSIRLLDQIESMGGKRVSFQRRLKKLKRREKRLSRSPLRHPATPVEAKQPGIAYPPYSKRILFPASFGKKRSFTGA